MHIPVDFGQCNYIFDGDALPTGAQITLGFSNDGELLIGDAEAVLRDAFLDNIIVALSEKVNLASIHVKFGPNDIGPELDATVDVAGSNSNSACSPAIAALITKRTGLGGRHNKGRMYLPGMVESNVTGAGVLDSSFVTALAGDFNNFWTDLVAGGLHPAVLHADSGAGAPTLIAGFNVSGIVATQRRRQRR